MNKYNPNYHHRHSIRLKHYDYAQEGLYFITICVEKRQCIFGNIVNNKMQLNEIGEIVCLEWLKTAELRPSVRLHNFVVMPNHFHGVFEIVKNETCNGITRCRGVARNAPTENAPMIRLYSRNIDTEKNEYMSAISPKSGEMGTIIRAFKSAVTKNIHLAGYDFVWQRNLYEHIIRDCNEYERITDYIINNPLRWNEDCFYVV